VKQTASLAILLGIALTATGPLSCSSGHGPPSSGAPQLLGDTGTVGAMLQVAPGVSISQLSWTIHNSVLLAEDRTGTADVSQSETIAFVVGGLPAGAGYTVTVTGATLNGLNCIGSGGFGITTAATTDVTVNVVCSARSVDAGYNGSVSVGGTVSVANACAAISSLSANPSSVAVGGSMVLAAQGVDTVGGSADVAFAWVVAAGPGSGTFNDASSASPTFACTTPGSLTVTVTASVPGSATDCTGNTASLALVCTSRGNPADAGMGRLPQPPDGGGVSDSGPSRPEGGILPSPLLHVCTGEAIQRFPITTPNAGPYGLTTDGTYLIFTEGQGNNVGFMDQNGNMLAEVVVTAANSRPQGIVADQLGAVPSVYFTEYAAGRIGNIPYNTDPSTGLLIVANVASDFPLTCPTTTFGDQECNPYGITVDSSDTVWWTQYGNSAIASATSFQRIASFPWQYDTVQTPTPMALPTAITPSGVCTPPNNPLTQVCTGPYDGVGVFYTEFAATVNGSVTGQVGLAFPVVGPRTDTAEVAQTGSPDATGIAMGPDGNVWFVAGTKVGYVVPTFAVGGFSGNAGGLYTIPTTNGTQDVPQSIAAGPDGNMWFTVGFAGVHALGQVATTKGDNPTNLGNVTFFGTGTGGYNGIVTGPDGNLWFTDSLNNSIDRLSFCP
jgi:hypothetical protein